MMPDPREPATLTQSPEMLREGAAWRVCRMTLRRGWDHLLALPVKVGTGGG